MLDDPSMPLWVTEEVRKADAAAERGLCCVALAGVWSWRGKTGHVVRTAIPDRHDIALNGREVVLAFDSDVMTKPPVRHALAELAAYLTSKGAQVRYAHLPDDGDGKTGLDDYLAEHSLDELLRLVRPDQTIAATTTRSAAAQHLPEWVTAAKPSRVGLSEARAVFRRWLGPDYDLDALDIVLSVAAGEQLPGDPAWLLIVSGSGAATTETVAPLAGAGAIVTSTLASEGALNSSGSTRCKRPIGTRR